MSDNTPGGPVPPDDLSLEAWVLALGEALGISETARGLDLAAVLDLARDAAHGVARPAAPLTTFLVGYAAALREGDPAAVRELASLATRLISERARPELG